MGPERGNLGVGHTVSSRLHATGSWLSRGREDRGAGPWTGQGHRDSPRETALEPGPQEAGAEGSLWWGVGWDLPLIWKGTPGLKRTPRGGGSWAQREGAEEGADSLPLGAPDTSAPWIFGRKERRWQPAAARQSSHGPQPSGRLGTQMISKLENLTQERLPLPESAFC